MAHYYQLHNQIEDSLVLTKETTEQEEDSNGLENFGLNEEEPNLFDVSEGNLSNELDKTHDQSDDNLDEDDYEIPAFLRRQKN